MESFIGFTVLFLYKMAMLAYCINRTLYYYENKDRRWVSLWMTLAICYIVALFDYIIV